ncbi:MAG: hypothetical protein ACFFDB_00025 [Promethearchaeota archaeon]
MGRDKKKKNRPEETFIINQFSKLEDNEFKTVKVFKAKKRKGMSINFVNLYEEDE